MSADFALLKVDEQFLLDQWLQSVEPLLADEKLELAIQRAVELPEHLQPAARRELIKMDVEQQIVRNAFIGSRAYFVSIKHLGDCGMSVAQLDELTAEIRRHVQPDFSDENPDQREFGSARDTATDACSTDGLTAAGQPRLTPAQDLVEQSERYDFVRLLGSGAMGDVCLVRDRHLDRLVALKLPKITDEKVLQRFQLEARSLARVNDPRICTVHDVGELDGVPYLTMEYVDGVTLSERLARGTRMNEEEACRCIREIADALSTAHEQGVVHRDVKPGNIMLAHDGAMKIMDFGLAAKERDGEIRITQSNELVGSPAYMAPEQINSDELHQADTQSDIYSLGVILFEVLTGQLPYDGPLFSVLSKIGDLNDTVKPPSAVAPGITKHLDETCARALAKQPKHRFKTMREFADAITGYLQDESSRVHSKSRGHALKWSVVGSAAVMFGLVIVLFTGEGNLKLELPASKQPYRVLIDGKSFDASQFKSPIRIRAGRHKIVIESGGQQRMAETLWIIRGQEKLLKLEADSSDDKTPNGSAPQPSAPKSTASFKYLPAIDADRFAKEVKANSREMSTFITSDLSSFLRFGHSKDCVQRRIGSGIRDGRKFSLRARITALATTGSGLDQLWAIGDEDGKVSLWSREIDGYQRTLDGHKAKVISLLFLPEPKQLISVDTSGSVHLWDISKPAEAAPKSARELPLKDLAHATILNESLICATADGKVLAAAIDGQDANEKPSPLHQVTAMANCKAKGTIAVAGRVGDAWAVVEARIEDGELRHRRLPIRSDSRVNAMAYSHDGRQLAIGTESGVIHLLNRGDQTASSLKQLEQARIPICGLRFSADAKSLLAIGRHGNAGKWSLPAP